MKKKLFNIVVAIFISGLAAQSQQPFPANAEAFYQKAMTLINSKYINWIKNTAQNASKQKMDESSIRNLATGYVTQNNLATMDIDALVNLIMMQTAKDEEQDLKNIMNEMEKTNKEKQQLRDAQNKMKQSQNSMTRQALDSFRLIAKSVNTTQTQPIKRTNVMMTRQASSTEIKQVQDSLKSKLDSMNEMSEMTSMRLQMAMDRRSKFVSTLSNIMKKISQTEDSIIQNMK